MAKTPPLHKRLARLYLPFDGTIRAEIGRDTRSCELHRAAELEERNRQRRIAWARRVYESTGRTPSIHPAGPWFIDGLLAKRHRLRTEQHGNTAIVPFPRRKRQYMHTRLPEPPEAA
ncbi:MAG TPA: hypothetical protein ENI94_13020 [Gammaproteobacteria bacterium]|nr:hypothetical protein [Gammaproteobacteria bacterium]